MASLRLSPAPSPYGCRKSLPISKLQRYEPEDESQEYSICDLKVRVSHKDTTVYRGLLTLPDSEEPVAVVVKTDFFAETLRRKAFEHEVDMYEIHLWELQDKAIPHCYGLFQYKGEDAKVSSFLVLRDCGDPIVEPRNLTSSFKSKVINAVYYIHFLGFTHGDLSYDNIIINKDGSPFIIDLEFAKPHVCGLKERLLIGEESRDVGCTEMMQCAALMRAWADVYVKLEGVYTFYRTDLRRGNMDYLLSLLTHCHDDPTVYRPYVEELVEQVEAEREFYRNIPPEKRVIAVE
ncbi:hypothetical protein PC9H_000407 [Pleurotus ostreatus]|uniref:Uncharacterized protein n=2 Tax=Pleurotus ostreatus TaxID=5322 RepID=A0A067PAH9_PLEO1|nr:uncharacterized protein PC9H_000407 [Pleurotus ostreatus]KAF7440065.1 hypothetical protein PC9H_000407 [Pleurotus ostreatus]KAJ8700689.1 hypothetical protein PTI98_003692 [Pleurotus ostreatus]KDQ32871.1 hypothetical protein PLEOSDRAFT_1087585 [Pleurotus ostreatus PC15]